MTTTPRLRRLPLLLLLLIGCSLLVSCTTGPDPADVAADRDRWTAVSNTTADGTVDAAERPVFDVLLAEWDRKLAADERALARPDTTVQDLIRVYGLATVQVLIGPELEKRAPELFRLADRDGDRLLSEAELLAMDPRSPVFAAVVVSTAARLLARK